MSCQETLAELLAELRALYLHYQHAHWQTSGPTYYADHQLFERLYTATLGEIDTLAEKIIGYYGPRALNLRSQAEKIEEAAEAQSASGSFLVDLLNAERKFQSMIKATYDYCKSSGEMKLGLDDFLMAMSSSHDTAVYLLQQRTMNALTKIAAKTRVEEEKEDVNDQAKELGKALNKKKKGRTKTNREIEEEKADVEDQKEELREAKRKKTASLISNGLSKNPWLK